MHRSRFSRLGFLLALPFLAFRVTALVVIDRMALFLERALYLFRPEPMQLAGGDPVLARDIDGVRLDRSLLHRLRHESGVPRRSAARNI